VKIPEDDYISVKDYQKMCGYASKSAVLAAIHSGRLEALNFYGTYLIRKNAILQTNRTGLQYGKFRASQESKKRTMQLLAVQGLTWEDVYGKDDEPDDNPD